jgi:hypothetical protein
VSLGASGSNQIASPFTASGPFVCLIKHAQTDVESRFLASSSQVINRDLSIAMLKYFVQRRQEEGKSNKQRKRPPKNAPAAPAPKDNVVRPAAHSI